MKYLIFLLVISCSKEFVTPEPRNTYHVLKDWDMDYYRSVEGEPVYPQTYTIDLPESKAITDTVYTWFYVFKIDEKGNRVVDYKLKRNLITKYVKYLKK